MQQKYGDNKRPNYSPSTSFNYGHSNGSQQPHRDSGSGSGGNDSPRRRVDRYRREVYNLNDQLVKQNETMIQLLREIRDRLPGPASIPSGSSEGSVSGASGVSVGEARKSEPGLNPEA